jgi:hypothetical protein
VWVGVLAVLAILFGVLGTATFAPGFMSNDTLYQLRQAQGTDALTDWHPPIMSLTWRLLIDATGTIGTMAALQQVVAWTGWFVVATSVYRAVGSRRWSLAFLALGLAPHILTISGVVWKDVQMAQAMLAATAIAMVGLAWRERRPAWLPWVLLPLAVALLGYALLVRKNAVVAILPMLYLLYRSWFPPRRPIALAVLVGSLLVVTGFTQVLINATAHPLKTDQLSAIAIDDVIHVVPRGALQKADLPIPLRDKLLAAQQVCDAKKSLMNNYWTCYGRGAAGPFTPIADHAALTKAWPGLMLQRPAGYLQYRSEVYGEFLFHNRDYWQDGVLANSMGIDVARPRMVATLRSYVVDGALRNFPWLFGAWFWLVVSVVQTLRLRSRSGFGVLVPCLGASSLLYILGYFPTAPATDYRYVYWPAVAGTLGLLVMALDRFGPRAPTASEGDHDGEGDGERKQRDGTTAEAGVSGATA